MKHTTPLPDRRRVPDRDGAATVAAPPRASTTPRRRPASPQWAAWTFLAPVTLYLILFYAYPI